MISPELSIITINRNNAAGLIKTLESVRRQTWRNFEVIIIDGASSDDSIKVLDGYMDIITVRVSEPDGGIYDAHNKGTRLARGKYCLYLNSGDILYDKDVLQKAWDANPVEDIIYFDNMLDDGDRLVLGPNPPKLREYHFYGHGIWHQSLIARYLFEKYGYYRTDYKISGDYEFFLRVILKYRVSFRYLPIVFVQYDTQGISANPKYRKLNRNERRRAWIENFGLLRYVGSFVILQFLLTYGVKKPLKCALGSQIYAGLKRKLTH